MTEEYAKLLHEELVYALDLAGKNSELLARMGLTVRKQDVIRGKSPLCPSITATARVIDPMPIPSACLYCGRAELSCMHHNQVYGTAYSEWPWMLRCRDCNAHVGFHPFTNIPLGTLANAALRSARQESKTWFLRNKDIRKIGKSEAYAWLAGKLHISVERCHFAQFNEELCKRAAQLCQAAYMKAREEKLSARKAKK